MHGQPIGAVAGPLRPNREDGAERDDGSGTVPLGRLNLRSADEHRTPVVSNR